MTERLGCSWGSYKYSHGAYASWVAPCGGHMTMMFNNYFPVAEEAKVAACNDLSDKRRKHRSTCILYKE